MRKTRVDKINDRINYLDRRIVSIVKENKHITLKEMSEALQTSYPTIYRHMSGLMEKNIIQRVGSRKNGYWNVIEER